MGRRLAFKADRDTRRDTEQRRRRRWRRKEPENPDEKPGVVTPFGQTIIVVVVAVVVFALSVSLWVSRKMKGTWLIHDRPS